MRAVLHDPEGLVTNVIVLPDDPEDIGYEPPEGLTLLEVDDDTCVGPGWTLTEDGTFTEPAPPADTGPTVAQLQAQAAALAGQLQQLQDQITTLAGQEPTE